MCAVSDLVLILAGVAGIGTVVERAPAVLDVVRWLGAAFLVGYGLLAARRAWRPSGHTLEAEGADLGTDPGAGTRTGSVRVATRALPVVLTCLALTWLNPHVYLDTVFLLGSVANAHGDGRWAFALGAGAASIVWFFALAYGARLLGGVLASPRAWRVLDGVIAVVMVALGISLVLPH